jgi:integrase
MTPKKVQKNGRPMWMLDLRHRGKGSRKYFETKAEAEAYSEARGRLHRHRRRLPVDHPTVGEYAVRVLAKREGTCAAATHTILRTQLAHLRAYEVRPGVPLSEQRLDSLDGDGELVVDLLKWQASRGYAVDSVRLLRNALKELLDRAKSEGYLLEHPLHDPQTQRDLRGLFKRLREQHPDDVKAMDAVQARRFLEVARQESRLFPLFATGFLTGPRLGELVALWRDDETVRIVEGRRYHQLHIARQLTQRMSRKNPQPKMLKNAADYHVDIPTALAAILADHKRTLRAEPPWLFQTSTGTPYSHEVVQGEFQRILRLAGLDDDRFDFSPHSMRHSFATLHILAGKPAKWVSEQLGHADVTVTLKVYAKWFRQVCHGAADDLGAQLLGTEDAVGTNVAPTVPLTVPEPAPVLH